MYLSELFLFSVRSREAFSVVWLIFQIWLQYGADGCPFRSVSSFPKTDYSQSGTWNIGIIMSVHAFEPGVMCSTQLRSLAILQRMESMVFAINEINAKKMLHPNGTLGFTIIDDCSNDLRAFYKAMTLTENFTTCVQNNDSKIVAVIGADSSTRTVKIADLLSVMKIPQLSVSATHPALDNMDKYSYFFRIVPSDVMQARAIVDILQQFNWSYVSMLYHNGFYGEVLYEGVKKNMSPLGYCFAVVEKINKEFDELDYRLVAAKLSNEPRAHVVILALTIQEAQGIFTAFKKNWSNNFTWIVAEYVGGQLYALGGVKQVLSGMLAIRLEFASVVRFDEFFKHLTAINGSRNPWFKEFFMRAFNCRSEEDGSCNWNAAIQDSPSYEPENSVSLSMDAVYVFAHAMKAVIAKCLDTTILPDCVDGKRLRDAIAKVKFRGEHVNISFNEYGSARGSYEIINFYFEDGYPVIKTVGLWSSSTENFTYFHADNITWNWELNPVNSTDHDERKAPLSRCGEPCPEGFQQMFTHKCCWNCSRCKDNERTVTVNGRRVCSMCPEKNNFTWPDQSTHSKCLPIRATFNRFTQKTSVAICVLNILVLLSAVTISILYIINQKNRLIKASSREISQMMLGGHTIVCLLAMTYFFPPVKITCALFQFWFPLSFSITYGPLLVKTNRIYRIFMRQQMTTKKPPFTSPKAQVVMVTVIIVIQITLSGMGLFIQPTQAVLLMPSNHVKYVELVCAPDKMLGITLSLIYILCLVVGCAVHAYKVRSLPSNFNEAKFIVISLYCIALLWIGVIPGYFTAETEIVRKRWLVVFMLLNMFVAQVFLLYPKLFAIYCLNMRAVFKKSYLQSKI